MPMIAVGSGLMSPVVAFTTSAGARAIAMATKARSGGVAAKGVFCDERDGDGAQPQEIVPAVDARMPFGQQAGVGWA